MVCPCNVQGYFGDHLSHLGFFRKFDFNSKLDFYTLMIVFKQAFYIIMSPVTVYIKVISWNFEIGKKIKI